MNCVSQRALHAADTLLLMDITSADNYLLICDYNKLPLLRKYDSHDVLSFHNRNYSIYTKQSPWQHLERLFCHNPSAYFSIIITSKDYQLAVPSERIIIFAVSCVLLVLPISLRTESNDHVATGMKPTEKHSLEIK